MKSTIKTRDVESLVGGLLTLKIALAMGLPLLTTTVLINKALKNMRTDERER